MTSDPTRSYVAGEWFGIFGERAVVLLPPSEKSRVAALWELVDDGGGFDEALDALIAAGLRDLPGFVLLSESDGTVKVVIRGAASATFDTAEGERTVEGSGATTWVEETVAGVRSLSVSVADAAGPSYGIAVGLVRVARVEQHGEGVAPDGATPMPLPRPENEPAPEPVLAPQAVAAEPEPEPEQPDAQAEPPVPEPEPLEEQGAAAFFSTPASAPPPPPATPPVPSTPMPSTPIPSTPAPVPPPVPVAAPAHEPDGDDTRSGAWGVPPEPESAPAPSSPAGRAVARLVFSHGDVVDVDRSILVGRAPEARNFAPGDQPRLVTVPSPQQEISSTHLEIRPGSGADHGSAVVTDLGSTNGTLLAQPGLGPEDLQPGIAVQLLPGAIVDLGEGVTIQVTQA